MKFCSECGTKFIGLAKFCGECGKPRADTGNNEAHNPGSEHLDWRSFVKVYKPRKNQFADVNEALDGCFFPSWGSVGDWTSFEELGYIWSVLASEGPFKRLQCKSGRWNGPNVIGYLFCEFSVPEDDDLAFHLPDNYTGFEGFILKVDEETGKWRPCRYRLKGDSTESIDVDKIKRVSREDELHRDLAEQSTFARASRQVMTRLTIWDGDERDSFAEKLDARYFGLAKRWTHDNGYMEEYDPLDESWQVGSSMDVFDGEELLMFNVPQSSGHVETGGRCPICDSEADSGEYSDHTCMRGEIEHATFASFNTDSKLQYIRANIPLQELQKDEAEFRERVLPYLLREFKAENISGFDHFERQENEMADSSFQLAFNREMFAWDRLTKACGRCFKYNPESAQVCYNCCNQFVEKIEGQIFASIVRDVDTDQIEEMEPEEFGAWADVYYFVAKGEDQVSFVSPPVLTESKLVGDLTARCSPLSGVDGFFNFVVKVGRAEWNFSGSTIEGDDEIRLLVTGTQVQQSSIEALEEAGWETYNSGQVDSFEKWHAFATDEDCADAIRLGLGWLQLITGASPVEWAQELEVHFGL